MSPRHIDFDAQLVINPELRRQPGPECIVHFRNEGDRMVGVPDETRALLLQFFEPRSTREVIPLATERELHAIAAMLDQRVLVLAGEPPRTCSVPCIRATTPFALAPQWGEDETGSHCIAVLGAKFDRGTLPQYPKGSAAGPDFVRLASRALGIRRGIGHGEPLGFYDVDEDRVLLRGTRIFDAGNIEPLPAATCQDVCARVEREVRALRQQGASVLLIGGDHSLTLPAIQGISEREIGLIHVDAHTDLAPILFSEDVHHGNVMRHVGALPHVKHILQIGHRGINLSRPVFDAVSYECCSVHRWRTLGPNARRALCRDGLPYYISVDIDAIDPSVAPGTPAPVPGGLLLEETRTLIRTLTSECRIVGADLVEVLPESDRPAITGYTAVQIIIELMVAMEASR